MSESMPPSRIGQAWADRFKELPQAYRDIDGLPFLRKFVRSPYVQLPLQYAHLTPGSRVLEGGCASGKFSVCFAMLGCRVTALDFSPTMLENTVRLQQAVESEMGKLDLTLVQGDLEHLGLAADQFDLVFHEGVVEHWLDHSERRAVLANMARVTAPGGAVAIVIPNGHHPLANYWIANHPGFISAPPMIRYNPRLLEEDIDLIGMGRKP